jgi:predicted transcriptional regulator
MIETPIWPSPRPTGYDVWSMRTCLGVTQKELAAYFGVSDRTIRDWERRGVNVEVSSPPIARDIHDYLTQGHRPTPREIRRYHAAHRKTHPQGR